MKCPLCSTGLKQHLLNPSLSIIACPSESCVYPFNMSISELHDHNLILSVSTADIMHNVHKKMNDNKDIDEKLAEFIARDDPEVS
ncbi:predicted protein [Scheffersomyces stipitis CBS 6054]|uniref:Uncharacterized protein n=1 Tax=Scheffersomyces stipitis (strain ATCC 58785 / CBS 6054 / NBRC 10063 / NRRL Y-11545) TaxID=322104 RepID=A3LWX4_PICST|nr:predicted protein [Scheffersomyces stipitis CBS 6054]ABN67710.1 predicted protein [Scheffersomyces stipitis CBS 6054]KAG2732606.1 hypothetical protein G9P44_005023 [Scheffersomyces stipitis]